MTARFRCIQYCAKVSQKNFDEIPGFSGLFKEISLEMIFPWNFTHIFTTPIVLICAIFWTLIYFVRWFTANFRVIIRSSWKVAVIFRTIMRSSRKFDNHIVYQQAKSVFKTQFANDLSNHCVRKKPLICRNSITAWRNVSYETHLVISEGMLNFWLDPKPQNTIVPINKYNCT